jgi:hypothetical protein
MGLALKNTPVNIKELFEGWESDLVQKNKSAHEVTFADDPIALSWASYHVWTKFPSRRWTDLNDVQAHEHDRTIAAQTRRYYRDKLMLQTLKGRPLSAYQTVLYGMVTGEAPIMSDQMGILMKLPYFYTEDVYLASVFEKTKKLAQHSVVPESRCDTITPLEVIFVARKGMETYQYWFANSQGEATVWIVNSQNPLRSLVDGLFNKKQPLTVQANWHYKRHLPTDCIHWNLGNVELVS